MLGFAIVVIFVKVSFGVEYCKEWVSTGDDQFRSHCYWYHTVATGISAFEADDECVLTGDGLAPYIDDEQYQFILDIRPTNCDHSFIGVMDVGHEGNWTHLDGTEIASTFDIHPNFQPNGGTAQNCATINACNFNNNNLTQDKDCYSFVTKGMICYRNTLVSVSVSIGIEYCKEWVSAADNQFRSQCYWYHNASTKLSAFEANDECALSGDGLAPYIDDEQYQFIVDIRPTDCPLTLIGVMDVGHEGNWTHLDGTEIANNGFMSTFDIYTLPLKPRPNGGATQNCAAIKACTHANSRHTDDKDCHSFTTRGMICYRNTLDTKNCLSWISKIDGKRRSHCYWVASKYPSMTSFTVTDAMHMCRQQSGIIAPIIDDNQFLFITNITDYYLTFIPNATIWTGTHNRGTRGQNWNLDPFNVSTNLIPSAVVGVISERCLTFSSYNISWMKCTTADVLSVVCYKTSAAVNASSNIQVSIEDIIQEITVDPFQTNAYKLSKISVYEDRFIPKVLGYVGIAICAGHILFIIILDCVKVENVPRKPKRKKRKGSKQPRN